LPSIVLLNGGSTNMLSRDAGLKKSPLLGMQNLIDWLKFGYPSLKIVNRNILRIEYPAQNYKVLHGMFLGTGLIYEIVKIYQNKIKKLKILGELNSILTALYVSFLFIIKKKKYLQNYSTKLNFNGNNQIKEDNYFFFLTTLDRLVLGLFPGQCENNHRIKFVLLRHGINQLFKLFFFLLTNKLKYKSCYYPDNGCLDSMEFTPCSGFILDGEFFEPFYSDKPVIVSDAGYLNFVTN
jgi:hypothetical protein